MGRAPCCDKSGLKKGPWTAEEDRKLVDYVQKHGHGSWRALPRKAGLTRCGKSCRLRWTNYLRPDIKRGRFSFEEEEIIIQLHKVLGNKWSAIATQLPGRTDNEIKNYWNTHIRKRLIKMGIDPVTHISAELSNLYNNPAAAAILLNLYGFLGLQPATELMKTAINLLLSQYKSSGAVVNNNQRLLNAAEDFQLQQLQDEVLPPNSTAINEGQILLQQGGQTCGGGDGGGLWQYNNISDNYDDLTTGADNLDPFLSQLLAESSCFEQTNSRQTCNLTSSGSSTPASSSNYIANSPSRTVLGDEDNAEGDSICSGLFEFQFPDLLDIGDCLHVDIN